MLGIGGTVTTPAVAVRGAVATVGDMCSCHSRNMMMPYGRIAQIVDRVIAGLIVVSMAKLVGLL